MKNCRDCFDKKCRNAGENIPLGSPNTCFKTKAEATKQQQPLESAEFALLSAGELKYISGLTKRLKVGFSFQHEDFFMLGDIMPKLDKHFNE